ncbi:hypothetical protein [Streptomyces sp. NPDC007205]|uniref:hypothetical protein n=1 Tax=Streptomyces sp. NPDC007205 TaxID=3154316 RepID=UPI00340524DF
MPIIGAGPGDPEYDNGDPAWEHQDTPVPALAVTRGSPRTDLSPQPTPLAIYAPANRYNGLDDIKMGLLATLTGVSLDAVRAAHKVDLDDWAREQQLRDHRDLAVLDADLDRIRHRS